RGIWFTGERGMIVTRRQLILSSTGTLLLGGLSRLGPALAATANVPPVEQLDALPGKRPLSKRSFRPPNYETPLELLREAYTPNDAFFVRYHLAHMPRVDVRGWRLHVGGVSANKSLELSLDDLRKRFELVTVAAINQCSGN